LRARPDLVDSVVRCRHCGIRFLTHPRNARREDLLCRFGCRQQHGRQRANARSRKHYRTPQGAKNKKHYNGKRNRYGRPLPCDVFTPPTPSEQPSAEATCLTLDLDCSGTESLNHSAAPRVPEVAGASQALSSEAVRPAAATFRNDCEAECDSLGSGPPCRPSDRETILGPINGQAVRPKALTFRNEFRADASGSGAPSEPSDSATTPVHPERQVGVANQLLSGGHAEDVVLPLDGLLLDEPTVLNSPMLPYLQMVVWLIEGQKISRDELVARLRRGMRQLSMGGRSRREYVLHYLNQHPPRGP
jgi:hypothetical protein